MSFLHNPIVIVVLGIVALAICGLVLRRELKKRKLK